MFKRCAGLSLVEVVEFLVVQPVVVEIAEVIGAELDPFENGVRHDEAIISKPHSRTKIMIVPTNEELMIARDTRDLVLEHRHA